MDIWISNSLSRILNFDVPDDLIQFILSIKSEHELNEYMKTLLDFSNQDHKIFLVELSNKMFFDKVPAKQKKKISKNKTQPEENVSPENDEKNTKRKTKFVNLYSQEGKDAQVVLLKGRHHCDCQATKHALINNCLQCGRIICKQEGSGPCLFCGNLVCSPSEQREINSKSKDGVKLMELLLEKNRPKGWEAAITHRNTLLEFDRNSERRTRVTDDDSDYFNANSVWLSASEKDKLQKYQQTLQEKKHASRLTKKMTFDFAGRQIIEDNTIDYEIDEDKIREITSSGNSYQEGIRNEWMVGDDDGRDVAPGINAKLLQFDPSVQSNYSSAVRSVPLTNFRVQDAEIQEVTDSGKCLSMHQPWASLLVEGIKLHEGRSWYSNHRGRLWIASTAKPPDQEVIKIMENQYRVLYPDKELSFPSFYPTGCLLGCVNVDDCLSREEYQKVYPGGESESPFVFICSNPISLRLRFPIKGQHKIYLLDKVIHQAAVKFIQKMNKEQVKAG